MDEITRKVLEALKTQRALAKEKWGAFVSAREEAQKEAKDAGEDVVAYLEKADTFQKMDDVHKEYSEVAQSVSVLEGRLEQLASMNADGPSSPTADEPKISSDPELGALGGKFMLPEAAVKAAAKRFVESDAYKAALPSIQSWTPGGSIKMEPVEILSREEFKTLVTGASATSGGAMVINDILPGLTVELPFRPTRILGLVGLSDTDSDTVEYVEQDSRTNAAAETAEATDTAGTGALPESATTFVVRTSPVQNVGHWIPATGRSLSDAGMLRGILENDLRRGVEVRLDGQLINGNGTAPNLRGILNVAGIGTQALGTDSRSDAFHKAMTVIEVASSIQDQYAADAVAMHNQDWEQVRLEKDANGNYIYGPPSQEGPLVMWGRPVAKSLAFTAGTGLVGAFREASRLFVRAGVTLAATDSHASFWTSDILAIKATMRVAFVVYRPAAFTQVTGI